MTTAETIIKKETNLENRVKETSNQIHFVIKQMEEMQFQTNHILKMIQPKTLTKKKHLSLLDLAGFVEFKPVSSEDIDRELYGK